MFNALQQGSGKEMSSATAFDKIRKVPIVDPNDDIAVNVKTKKKKKKKTGNNIEKFEVNGYVGMLSPLWKKIEYWIEFS
jgi:3-hydroxymyristoyl/3-hydroxydecanoyl-(acyl carrier protein) dehydratase